MKKLVLILALLFSLVAFHGCTPLRPYQTQPSPPPAADGTIKPAAQATPPTCNKGSSCLAYVEYDEFGRPFNRGQLNDAIAQAELVAKDDGIVVVFVHGWHHGAAPGDENVSGFRQVLQRAVAIDQAYTVRQQRPVLGIYVGWRGESVDGDHWYSWPFSQLTFWDRKNTAHDVGNGDVYELLVKLSLIRGAHASSRLVVIGHSFGGAIVYSALSHKLIEQIATDPQPGPGGDAQNKPAGRWDLAMLVNPAFEAMKLRPQFDMARAREYRATQTPHLVLITTQADWATGTAFPLGRTLSTLFDNYAGDDSAGRAMNNTAVGQYIPFITHQAALAADCRRGVDDEKIAAGTAATAVATTRRFCFNDKKALIDNGAPLLLTRCDTDADCGQVAPHHHIARGAVADGLTSERMPIMNIRTTADVMVDHNDIWNPTMQGFLTQFVILSIYHPDQL